MEQIIGSLYPILVSSNVHLKPKEDDDQDDHFFETFLEVAVCVGIMAFVPGAAAAMIGGMEALTTAAAGGSMIAAAEIGASYGAAGMVASAASQGIEMGFGTRKSFDVTAMVTQGVASAISAGVFGRVGGVTGNIIKDVVVAETVAIGQQIALVAMGLQKNYDWKTLTTAAFNGVVNDVVGNRFSPVETAGATSLLDTVGDDLILGNPPTISSVSANTLGNMVGTKIGNNINDALHRQFPRFYAQDAGRGKVSSQASSHLAHSPMPQDEDFSDETPYGVKKNQEMKAAIYNKKPQDGNSFTDRFFSDVANQEQFREDIFGEEEVEQPQVSTTRKIANALLRGVKYNVERQGEQIVDLLVDSYLGVHGNFGARVHVGLDVFPKFIESVPLPAGKNVQLTEVVAKSVSKIGLWGKGFFAGGERLAINASGPSEIAWGYGNLSKRQAIILGSLKEPGRYIQLYKSDINLTDLAALTAQTGDEFALFTLGSRRIVIRGTAKNLEINNNLSEKLLAQNWRWTAHTHPGLSDNVLIASGFPGDRQVLNIFNQKRSLILNSVGRRSIFDQENDYAITNQLNNSRLSPGY